MNFREDRETIQEKLERLDACGMGYPSEGLPCIRPNGHSNPVSNCFALIRNRQGETVGCYMQQDGKEWVTDPTQFPPDLVITVPLFRDAVVEQVPDRRGLVAHSKGKS